MEKKSFTYVGYDEYLYTGLQGWLMRQNHRILSRNVDAVKNRKILEIGGAAKPHCSLVELTGVEEYWISDSEGVFSENKELAGANINKHIFEKDPQYKYFLDNGYRFSRIIASHVWEHVHDPEGALLKWVDLLTDDGQLDIAIPCDPGWFWRLGQLVGRKKAVKVYGMTSSAIDLMMAREHINPCQNLIRIMRYYSDSRGSFYPFGIPVTDINLFVFFRVKKKDFIR